MSVLDEKVELAVTFVYWLLAICFIAPPTEFVSAGLTVQNVFSSVLGSEDMNFIDYHIKRTSITMAVHASLPLVYYMLLVWFAPDMHLTSPSDMSMFWKTFLVGSIVAVCLVALLIYYWSRGKWGNHPIAKACAAHSQGQPNWCPVASSIDTEFRRIDKFVSGPPGRRMYITDSWVLQTTTYMVHIAHQQDIHLTLSGSRELALTREGGPAAQFLTVTVGSIHPGVADFNLRVRSTDYAELKDQLQRPVRNARQIVVRQSLSEMFIDAFGTQVRSNPPYVPAAGLEELEPCIGCMQERANVKLLRRCEEEQEQEGEGGARCGTCYCRPMWCLSCMARWFASRQDQQDPGNWMGGRSPCPTCRSPFCLLDVSLIPS